jgi:hypothetical protein
MLHEFVYERKKHYFFLINNFAAGEPKARRREIAGLVRESIGFPDKPNDSRGSGIMTTSLSKTADSDSIGAVLTIRLGTAQYSFIRKQAWRHF